MDDYGSYLATLESLVEECQRQEDSLTLLLRHYNILKSPSALLFQMKHQIIPNSLKDSFEPIIRLTIKNISSFHFDQETWTFSLEIATGSNISVKRSEFFRRFSSFPGGPVITKDFLLEADDFLTSHFKYLMDTKCSLKLILNPLSREALCQWPTNVLYSFRISLIDFLVINTEKKSQKNIPLKCKTLTFPVLLPDWAVIFPEEFLQKVQQRQQCMNTVAIQGNLWPFFETEFHIFKPNSRSITVSHPHQDCVDALSSYVSNLLPIQDAAR